jgi:3-methylcrotonyl-CoA carboxylase alpha subunit
MAVLHLLQQEAASKKAFAASTIDQGSSWNSANFFRVNDSQPRNVALNKKGEKVGFQVQVTSTNKPDNSFNMTLNGKTVVVRGSIQQGKLVAFVGDECFKAAVVQKGDDVHVFVDGSHHSFTVPSVVYGKSSVGGSGAVSPMAGKVVKVNVKAGDSVKAGASLMVMEAMKMEHIIKANVDGVVDKVLFSAGDFVEGGKVVVVFVKKAGDDE